MVAAAEKTLYLPHRQVVEEAEREMLVLQVVQYQRVR